MKQKIQHQKGTALITLLIFTLISTIISSAAITIMMVNTSATSQSQQGNETLYIAESGIENGILRLLRDPSYSGESMTINGGTAVIRISGTGPYTIESAATKGNYTRTLHATVGYSNNILTISSWGEVYN